MLVLLFGIIAYLFFFGLMFVVSGYCGLFGLSFLVCMLIVLVMAVGYLLFDFIYCLFWFLLFVYAGLYWCLLCYA